MGAYWVNTPPFLNINTFIMNKLNITFERFWSDFHFKNKGLSPINKGLCDRLWRKCVFSIRKERAIKEIVKCNDVYEYLKDKLTKP